MTKNNNFCAVILLHLSVIWWTDCLNNYFLYNVSLMPCLLQPLIREGAVAALRAALTVTSQREGKASQTFQWYKVSIVSLNTLGTVFTKALMHTTLRLHYNAVHYNADSIIMRSPRGSQIFVQYTLLCVKMSADDRGIHNASCENRTPWVFPSQVWYQLIFPEAVSTGHSIYNAYVMGDHV